MTRAAALAFAAWMLACVAAAICSGDATWCAAGGVVAQLARIVVSSRRWTPTGRFGVANLITLGRLVVVASLGGLYLALPRLAFVAVLLALFALDAVDGRVARARAEASPFGAELDMETDALSIAMLSLLLWQHGLVAAWVLVAGLWRYVYAAIVAVVPSLGEAPRSQFARVVFVVLALSLAGAFLPSPGIARALAALGTVLVSISFLRSFAYSIVAAR